MVGFPLLAVNPTAAANSTKAPLAAQAVDSGGHAEARPPASAAGSTAAANGKRQSVRPEATHDQRKLPLPHSIRSTQKPACTPPGIRAVYRAWTGRVLTEEKSARNHDGPGRLIG